MPMGLILTPSSSQAKRAEIDLGNGAAWDRDTHTALLKVANFCSKDGSLLPAGHKN
jgi:hypothetical protein